MIRFFVKISKDIYIFQPSCYKIQSVPFAPIKPHEVTFLVVMSICKKRCLIHVTRPVTSHCMFYKGASIIACGFLKSNNVPISVDG